MIIIKKIFKWVGIIIGVLLFIFIVLLVIPETETIKPIQPRESTEYWEMSEGFKEHMQKNKPVKKQKGGVIKRRGGGIAKRGFGISK